MLLGTDLTMTQKDFAQTAQDCGKALIILINDVLDRAKFEAGRLELEEVPFDLRTLTDDVISLFASKLRAKCIEVSYYCINDSISLLCFHSHNGCGLPVVIVCSRAQTDNTIPQMPFFYIPPFL